MSALRAFIRSLLALLLGVFAWGGPQLAIAQTLTSSIAVGAGARAVAVNHVTNTIYVANEFSNSVTVIDGATLRTMLLVTGSNGPIAINDATNSAYVIRLGYADEVTRIRADNTWHTMAIESYTPVAQALDARANKLYVANYTTGDIRTVDLSSTSDFPPTRSVGVWGRPVAVALNSNTGKLYVIGEDSRGPINIVDTAANTAVSYAPAGHARGPKAIGVNTATNKVYAAFAGEILVIDGATNAMTFIASGDASRAGPVAIGINERTNKIYVANAQGFVAVIDGATNAVTSVPVPQNATALAVNSVTNEVYVSAGALAVIDGAASASTVPAASTPGYNVQGPGGDDCGGERDVHLQQHRQRRVQCDRERCHGGQVHRPRDLRKPRAGVLAGRGCGRGAQLPGPLVA